jgi:small membrane protein
VEPLNLFQTIAVGAFGVLIVLTLILVSRGRTTLRAGLGWSLLWVAGLLTVLFPDSTKILADILGINRGVDVILYSALFAGLAGFFVIYLRFRRLERQMTVLTRELALMAAESQLLDVHSEHQDREPEREPPP